MPSAFAVFRLITNSKRLRPFDWQLARLLSFQNSFGEHKDARVNDLWISP